MDELERLADMNEEAARDLTMRLLSQLWAAQGEVERLERRAVGIRKMIDGLVEMFPAVEDDLPEDFDADEDPRPRGAEAVRRVLADNQGEWYTVPAIVAMLQRQQWLPKSSKPANAVRTALERLVDAEAIEKGRSAEGGAVIYRLPKPPPPAVYEYGEEPF